MPVMSCFFCVTVTGRRTSKTLVGPPVSSPVGGGVGVAFCALAAAANAKKSGSRRMKLFLIRQRTNYSSDPCFRCLSTAACCPKQGGSITKERLNYIGSGFASHAAFRRKSEPQFDGRKYLQGIRHPR